MNSRREGAALPLGEETIEYDSYHQQADTHTAQKIQGFTHQGADMSFTVGKHCGPSLVVIALVIIVAFLAFLVTAKNHDNRSNIPPLHSQN